MRLFRRRRNHAFLFGAGASFGSEAGVHVPPLGNKLYEQLKGILRVAPEIEPEVEALFSTNFEQGMDELMRRKSWTQQSFQQDLARYFVQFEPGPSNYYRRLVRIFGTGRVNTLLASLNYDILLERSMELEGVTYNHIITRDHPHRSLPIYKLHGSCNIVPDPPAQIRGILIDLDLPNFPLGERAEGVGGDRVKSLTRTELLQWLEEEDTLVPCVAMYAASKMMRDHATPFIRLQRGWASAIHNMEALFIIGVRMALHDRHIWDPISSFKGKIYWVSPHAEEALDWGRDHGLRIEHFAKDFGSFVARYDLAF